MTTEPGTNRTPTDAARTAEGIALVINDQTAHDGTDPDTAEPLAAHAPVTEQDPLFADLGVRPETVAALTAVGIDRAFAIQELTLPIALGGDDVIGQARTGTGKTLGFGIPILQQVVGPDEGADGVPQALVVVPTRELCVQVARDIATAGATRKVRTLAIYGGRAYEPQVAALRHGIDIVVGTPGRLLDLAQQGHLVLGKVQILVLDEADEMLDLGFLPDIERVLAMVPDQRQTMLFSATMPGPIIALARHFMRRPVHIRAEHPDEGRTVPETAQHVFRAHAMDKIEVVARILQAEDRGLTMVFCRTKRTAQKVADDLAERGFAAAAVHGDLGQGAREQALRAFRNGKVDVLVATDVAGRGIDVSNVTHVINYQCPEDEKVYLHRIGRTGRAGADGVAVTFVDWDEIPRWKLINAALDLSFPEPQETYSSSPHLYAELSIPQGVSGRLPKAQRTRAGLSAEQVEDLGETGRGPRGGRDAGRGSGRAGSGRHSGSPDRGEARDRADSRGRGASAAAGTPTDPAGGTEPGDSARPLRSRSRRRTRGGLSGSAAAPPADGAGQHASPSGPGDEGAPRRRRRRGGRGRGTTGATGSGSGTETNAAADA